MSQQFLVELIDTLDDEPAAAHITAPHAATAITTFLTTFAPTNATFLNYVSATSINLSFAERFWIQSDEDDELFDQGRLQLSDETFAERVQEFFGAHQDYADLYLTYYFNADSAVSLRPSFPPEMLAYIWQRAKYGEVRAIPVGEG